MDGLARSNLVVAGGTAASRLTGLVRIVVFAALVGQTALADAFDAANNSPNAIYELLIGGVLSATLVPAFAALLVPGVDPATARRDVGAVFGVGLVIAALLTAVAVAAAPLVFRLYSLAPSEVVDAAEFRRVGTLLARVFLVQILFYAVSAVTAAALQARGRFAAAAWSPVASNVVAIGFLLGLNGLRRRPELEDVVGASSTFWLLGASGTVAVATMAIVQLVALRRTDSLPALSFDWRNPTVRRLVRLSGWTFGYVAANQAALVAVKNLASPGSGLVDAYGKAFVIFTLPHGLLAVSLATTFVPLLARAAARGDLGEFATRFGLGLRLTVLATIPAAVGGTILARPIVATLLGWGNFDAQAVGDTSRALAGLAVGLAGFSAYLFVLRGFYALGDTRTPFVLGLGQNALNVALAVVLVRPLDVLGLGLAYSASYLIAALVALGVLSRRVPGVSRESGRGIASVGLAGMAMAVAMLGVLVPIAGDGRGTELARFGLASTTGLAVFLLVARAAGNPDLRMLAARLVRR